MAVQTQAQVLPKLTRDQWQDIQGFIVYGYGALPYGRYLFLHIDNKGKAKEWLVKMKDAITTVEEWAEGFDRDVAVNLAFRHVGLKALGLSEQTLATFSREFIEGMADKDGVRSRNLGDIDESDPKKWEILNPSTFGTDDEAHILLMFNCQTKELMDGVLTRPPFDQLADKAQSGLRIVEEQWGFTPPSKKEPFGFRDGISNPWVEGTRGLKLGQKSIIKERHGKKVEIGLEYDPVIRTGEFILGYENEYNLLPQTPLVWGEKDVDLPPVPLSDVPHNVENLRDFGKNGSYIVYRKLAQDVPAFWEYIAQHAESDPQIMAHVAAKCVGRWASGVPLAISPDHDDVALAKEADATRNNSLINNFHYIGAVSGQGDDDDTYGFACPVGSHIRRSNARDSLIDDKSKPVDQRYRNNNQHRLMRRSVSWGKLADHQVYEPKYIENAGAPTEITYEHSPEYDPKENGAGIHFFAVNANINQQFEFVMQAWSNDGHFNGLYANKDSIIGKNSDDKIDPNHMTIPRRGDYRQQLKSVNRFVTVRGGAYFFMPSMRALDYLLKR